MVALQSPKIDNRTYQELVEQTTMLVQHYTPEYQPASDKADFGTALIHIFAGMVEQVIDRLNQAPQKNLLAFLDLLGASLTPAQPARVPLTFTLVDGAPAPVVVRAGTQVAALPMAGVPEPVIFETERALMLTTARLAALYLYQPEQETLTDLRALATLKPSSAPSRADAQALLHQFYLEQDELLRYPDLQKLTLTMTVAPLPTDPASTGAPDPRAVQWQLWDGESAIDLTPSTDETDQLTRSGSVIFDKLPAWQPSQSKGRLSCQLQTPITPAATPQAGKVRAKQLPIIQALSLAAELKSPALPMEQAFANLLPVDLNNGFLPFGEKPKTGDTLYLAHTRLFAIPGATVTLAIKLLHKAQPSPDLALQWEVWDGQSWTLCPPTRDTTAKLTQTGEVAFTLPTALKPATVNGVQSYWLCVRITQGNYGDDARYEWVVAPQFLFVTNRASQSQLDAGELGELLRKTFQEQAAITLSADAAVAIKAKGSRWLLIDNNRVYSINTEGEQLKVYLQTDGYQMRPATLTPPLIQSIKASYTLKPTAVTPQRIGTQNGPLSSGPFTTLPFQPFTAVTADVTPTLYWGFCLPSAATTFPNQAVSFFVHLAEQQYPASAGGMTGADEARFPLVWRYWNGREWTQLQVLDETNNLRCSGMIEFLAPVDWAVHPWWGAPYFWLQVSGTDTAPLAAPPIAQVLLNTTMASQGQAIVNEVLGSSDGSRNQCFHTTLRPILTGQQLEVCEPEKLLAQVQAKPRDATVNAPTTLSMAPAISVPGFWVPWSEVTDFYASTGADRHYIVNHSTGEIRFGDGVNGLIPPTGRNNIRLAHYRTGGGRHGNQPTRAIAQLKNTIPYVTSVTNLIAASGGADAETTDALIERAPRLVRHGNRAVTVEDYADLTYLASPAVARAKCVPGQDLSANPLATPDEAAAKTPGCVSVIIVPRSDDVQPQPDQELLRRVRVYLQSVSLPTVKLVVVGPHYLRVNVTTEIAIVQAGNAREIQQQVQEKLARFLHPLTGGGDGKGWVFGRSPQLSDLYAVIEAVPGVDHVRTLTLPEAEQADERERQNKIQATGRFLVCAGLFRIDLTLAEA